MSKRYDLEDRTLNVSRRVFDFVKLIPITPINQAVSKQLIRSASSIGANDREANEALGRKDFMRRLRISRKEAKETIHWLELTDCQETFEVQKYLLIDEATQLMKIFGSIVSRFEKGRPKKPEYLPP